jgi:TatD DNase family protein
MHSEYPWLLPAVGIHPNEYAERSIPDIENIEELIGKGKVVAVGETGLDYYRDFSPKEAQKELFRRHINIARKCRLPVIIHTRNSTDDAIQILQEEDYHAGVFHCYSGTLEQAHQIIDLGLYLGFGGFLTFSKKTREIFRHLPVDRVVLETDAPFLAPQGHRGARNEPAFIIETLGTAATLTGMPAKDLGSVLENNARTLFSIK